MADNDNGTKRQRDSAFLNRSSLASRLTATNLGISRKEFKPTIPTRRKKALLSEHEHSASSTPRHEFKDRGSPKFEIPTAIQKKGYRKQFVRANSGLFGGTVTDNKVDPEEHFSSSRSAAELEEEKYIDPFHQSTNELTPVTLPINPRIDSKRKLLVGKATSVADDHEPTVSEVLYRPADDESESTYLFNLPDILPVAMSKLSVDDKGDASSATIHSLPEGYLGRLQILKSGKVRIMIGDVPLEVALHSKSGFLQELLCCQTQSLDKGTIANIGTIPYTLAISPQYDELIS